MSLPTQTSSPQVSAWRPTGASNYSEEDDALQDQEVVPIAEQLVTPLASASLIEDTSMNIVSLIQYIWTTDMVRKYSSSVSGSTRDQFAQVSTEISNSMTEEEFLGAGLTFSVTKKWIPKAGPARRIYSAGAEYVAVKHVNSDNRGVTHGSKTSAKIIKDVAIEIRCLTVPYLRYHENIITLLSIGWDRDPDSNTIWPTLYLEYAEFGSLYSLQAKPLCLQFDTKRNLLLDIANGLQALHACKIVHGDIKRENTIIFRHDKRGYIAKLSDFGCSLADFPDPMSHVKIGVPFSYDYAAPEMKTLGAAGDVGILPSLLPATDVYSFGMTAWWTFMDGISPQKCLPGLPLHDEKAFIETLEDQDIMSKMAGEVILTQRGGVYSKIQIDVIVAVFESTIRTDPNSRDLKKAIDSLDSLWSALSKCKRRESLCSGSSIHPEMPRPLPVPQYAINFVTSLDYVQLDQGVKRQIFTTMKHMAENDENWVKHYAFPIAFCLLKGLGTNIDSEAGLRWMSKAALTNNVTAANLILGTHRSLHIEPLNYQQVLNWTHVCIVTCGSYSALRQWAKERGDSKMEYVHLIQEFHQNYWDEVYQIHKTANSKGWDLKDWGNLLEKLREWANAASEQGVGLRFSDFNIDVPDKNHLLHFLAMCGSEDCLYIGISQFWTRKGDPEFGLDVDCQNILGETPLLQATRACRIDIVDALLKYGARADKLTINKQSPLHWLSFMIETKDTFQRLVNLMVQRGGDLNQFSDEGVVSHVMYGTNGVNPYGTPLHFAVFMNNVELIEALLEARADPTLELITTERRVRSAMYCAATLRQHGIVEKFLEAAPWYEMSWSQKYPQRGSLMQAALIAAERQTEWMIIHGQEEPCALLQFFQMLERRGANFTCVGDKGENALQVAIESNASCDVFDYLLKFKPTLELNLVEHLWRPISLNNKPLFDLILERVDDVNKIDSSGYTALHRCVVQTDDDTYFARKLLDRGAEPNISNDNRETPLLLALAHGMFDHAKLLLPLTSGLPAGSKRTLLGLLVASTSRYILPSVELVLQMKAPETSPLLHKALAGVRGYTVFHRVAEHEIGAQNTETSIALIDILLKTLGSKEIINCQMQQSGLTALHLAVLRQHMNLVERLCNVNISAADAEMRLCKEGADPDIRSFEDEEQPPLLRNTTPRELAALIAVGREATQSFRIDIEELGPSAMARNLKTRREIYNILAFQHGRLKRAREVNMDQ